MRIRCSVCKKEIDLLDFSMVEQSAILDALDGEFVSPSLINHTECVKEEEKQNDVSNS